MKISLIAAIGKNNQLGLNNQMLWHVPEDFKNFKKLTMGHYMVMGRKTYDSIGRPLPGRTTIVLTRDKDLLIDGVKIAHSVEQVIEMAMTSGEDELFVAGGAQIYSLFLEQASDFYLSEIDFEGEADAFFPEFKQLSWKCEEIKEFSAGEKTPAWAFKHLVRN